MIQEIRYENHANKLAAELDNYQFNSYFITQHTKFSLCYCS